MKYYMFDINLTKWLKYAIISISLRGKIVLVDKLIRGKIIEVIIVLLLVGASVPAWNAFEKHISKADVMTVDDYNLVYNTQK